MKKLIPLLPVVLLVFVSGCTIEDINPFDGGNNKGSVNDIIVIREGLRAIPREIKPNQSTRIEVNVQNNLDPLNDPPQIIPLNVKLIDWCSGAFEPNTDAADGAVSCPDDSKATEPSGKGAFGCEGIKLGNGRTKTVFFNLRAGDVKGYECNFKIEMDYHVETESATDIRFINFDEYSNRLRTGTLKEFKPNLIKGEGPVKIYFKTKGDQPIPVSGASEASQLVDIIIENEGSGVLKDDEITIISISPDIVKCKDDEGKEITAGKIKLGNRILQCTIQPRKDDLNPETGNEVQYLLKLKVGYDYKLSKTTEAKIV